MTEPTRVLVTGPDIDQEWLKPLYEADLAVEIESEALGVDALCERLTGVAYYLYGGVEAADELTEAHLARLHASGLALIAFAGKGVTDFLNVPAATAAGIAVTNTPGAVEPSVAEFTAFLTLAILRSGFQRSLLWMQKAGLSEESLVQNSAGAPLLGLDLSDVSVGVLGLGDIGYLVSKLLTQGFGARVVYFSRQRKEAIEAELGITYIPLDRLANECDLLSIHLANTRDTRDLVAGIPLEEASSPFYLVNTASEALIAPDRLAKLLETGTVVAAAFDKIYSVDTLRSSGLFHFVPDRLLVTNHSANATISAWRRMTMMAVSNILAQHAQAQPPNLVRLSNTT